MKQPNNKYRYKITNRLGTLQAAPLGESNFTIEWTREDEGKLDYKNELPSKIIFRDEVYRNLLRLEQSIYRCDYVTIAIERRCMQGQSEDWVPWFSGRMSFNDATWDLDRCEVEIKLDDIKEEQCFEDNKTKELNLLQEIVGRRTVFLNPTNITIEKATYIRLNDCEESPYWGGTGEPYSQGWNLYEYSRTVDHNFIPDKCDSTWKWARETTLVACEDPAPGPEWILVEDTCPGGDRKYARPPRLYGCQYTFPDLGTDIEVSEYKCFVVGDTASNVSIDNGVTLEDVVNLFMSSFCPGLTFVSNFFQINPDVASTINYVTGQRSKTMFLTLFQKSDVKRPTILANASKANLSFEKLINALVAFYNMRWRIVGSVFRMEHVSYFSKMQGLDLTTDKYARYMVGKRKYSYENQEIPAREEFKAMEAGAGDFEGVPIIYSGGCVSQESRNNIKTHTVEKFTADVELVLSNPEPDSKVVSDDGFVLMGVDFDGTNYFIITESSILGGSSLNNSLAWAQLHRDYHKYDRPLSRGNMNNIETDFLTTKPTKKGEKVTIPLCCGDIFNPDHTVKTALGVGTVQKATFSFKDETLQLDLLYAADEGLTNNIAPVAQNDVVFTYQNQPITIVVLNNDNDPDGLITLVQIILAPTHGTAVLQSDKTILYTPAAGYNGPDLFVYKIFDDWNQPSNSALVNITVRPPNQAPIAVNDSYIAQKDTILNVPAGAGLFANDSDDVDFELDIFDATSVEGGTVIVNTDGSFSFDPFPGFVGTDSFTYRIKDTPGLTDTATVTIDVRDPDNPVAVNDGIYTTKRNQNLVVLAPGLLANDTTTIGTLTATAGTFATAQSGSVTISADGSFTYSPPSGYTGPDSFTYTADNGTGTDTATALINVLPDIYVKLQQNTFGVENLSEFCGGSLTNVGIRRYGKFRLLFYSNAGGTIPFDVTGLNLAVNYRITGDYYDIPGTYNNDDTISPVSGTTFNLFGGADYTYQITRNDCSGEVVEYLNETITLRPGDYTII
jgi:hypothetical protein